MLIVVRFTQLLERDEFFCQFSSKEVILCVFLFKWRHLICKRNTLLSNCIQQLLVNEIRSNGSTQKQFQHKIHSKTVQLLLNNIILFNTNFNYSQFKVITFEIHFEIILQ